VAIRSTSSGLRSFTCERLAEQRLQISAAVHRHGTLDDRVIAELEISVSGDDA
jgi:hypothetical protein